jgi:hypothetical protein
MFKARLILAHARGVLLKMSTWVVNRQQHPSCCQWSTGRAMTVVITRVTPLSLYWCNRGSSQAQQMMSLAPWTARASLECPSRKVRVAEEHPNIASCCSCGQLSASRPSDASSSWRQKDTSSRSSRSLRNTGFRVSNVQRLDGKQAHGRSGNVCRRQGACCHGETQQILG